MQSDSMSDGQDISLQGAYRQDQGAKLEVIPTDLDVKLLISGSFIACLMGSVFYLGFIKKDDNNDKGRKK